MNPILEKVIIAGIPTIVSFVIGWLIGMLKKAKGKINESTALQQAVIMSCKYMMKRLIIDDCKYYIEQGYIKPTELADIEQCWEIYHNQLKGNHEAGAYYDIVKKLPVKDGDNNESK